MASSALRHSRSVGNNRFADVLTRIVNSHPNSQIDDLLPWAYPTEPELKAVA